MVAMAELMSNKVIGQKIKARRLELGWTQKELGEKMGVRNTAVNKWELGLIKNLKVPTIKQLAEVLGLDPLNLIGMEAEPATQETTQTTQKEKQRKLWADAYSDVEFSDEEFSDIMKYANFIISQRK